MSATQSDAEKAVEKSAKKVSSFKVRGNLRGRKALNAIKSIGALANRKLHTWDSAQVEKLFAALDKAVVDARAQFDKSDEPILAEADDLL